MTIEIDHTGLSVSDYEAAKKFYTAALKPLRVELLMEFPASVTGTCGYAGLGADGKPFFWLASSGKTAPKVHIAIRAERREQVDAFYQAAIAAGGTDNGPPGLRPLYHEHYYSAFVLDADGHNIEVVCHKSPEEAAEEARNAQPRKKRAAAGTKASAARKRASSTGKTASAAGKRAAPAKRAATGKRRATGEATTRKRAAAGRKTAARRKPAGKRTR